jgi:hypothetical protein
LTEVQRKELDQLLEEFDGVTRGKNGQTHVAEHSINCDARPIRQAPYRIPHAYREEVMKELKGDGGERNN